MTLTQKVARYLRRHDIPVLGTKEPDDLEDGMVEITEHLHVQIPLYGSATNTVRETDRGTFVFGKECHTLAELLVEIRKQL